MHKYAFFSLSVPNWRGRAGSLLPLGSTFKRRSRFRKRLSESYLSFAIFNIAKNVLLLCYTDKAAKANAWYLSPWKLGQAAYGAQIVGCAVFTPENSSEGSSKGVGLSSPWYAVHKRHRVHMPRGMLIMNRVFLAAARAAPSKSPSGLDEWITHFCALPPVSTTTPTHYFPLNILRLALSEYSSMALREMESLDPPPLRYRLAYSNHRGEFGSWIHRGTLRRRCLPRIRLRSRRSRLLQLVFHRLGTRTFRLRLRTRL